MRGCDGVQRGAKLAARECERLVRGDARDECEEVCGCAKCRVFICFIFDAVFAMHVMFLHLL